MIYIVKKHIKTADQRRAIRHDEYREKLKVSAIINNLIRINKIYMSLLSSRPAKVYKKFNPFLLKDAWTLNLKLLNKFLPDQKQVTVELDREEELLKVMRVPISEGGLDQWGLMAEKSQAELKKEVHKH